jgi:AcrR family transcriptional regulator
MSRPRAFDENDVLGGAMNAFRRTGFSTISIRTLEEATGLSAGSIYHTYGDKAGRFKASFAHYLQEVLQRRIASHAGPDKGLAGVRALFQSLLREPGGASDGCLITNSAVEFGSGGMLPADVLAEAFEILRAALQNRLEDAKREKLLPPGFTPAIAALRLVAFYQGLLVLVRAGYDKRRLKQAIDLEFDTLEGN